MKYTSKWLLARFETLLSESYEMKMARVLLLLLIWVFFASNAYTCLIMNICVLIFWLSNERHIYETWYLTTGHDLFFTPTYWSWVLISARFFSQTWGIKNSLILSLKIKIIPLKSCKMYWIAISIFCCCFLPVIWTEFHDSVQTS